VPVEELQARRERAAKNESLFRGINERVEEMASSRGLDEETLDLVCECASLDCAEKIEMKVSEYEAVRQDPARFAVAVGHEVLGVEDVVVRTTRFVVVEKIGAGEDVARKLDPRAQESA
jgi:hypothetical protein